MVAMRQKVEETGAERCDKWVGCGTVELTPDTVMSPPVVAEIKPPRAMESRRLRTPGSAGITYEQRRPPSSSQMKNRYGYGLDINLPIEKVTLCCCHGL